MTGDKSVVMRNDEPAAGRSFQTNGKDARVARILNDMRAHLQEALGNNAVKKIVFTFELNNGGVRRSDIDVGVQYTYVNTSAG